MDKKEALIKMLSQFSKDELSEILGEPRSKRKRGKGKRKKNSKKEFSKKTSDKSENKFDEIYRNIKFTDGEKAELEAAAKSDKNATVNPLRGQRSPVEKLNITCCRCREPFKVSPSLVHDVSRWTCNGCITGKR
tara:strand:- start:38487 stop:38888 length:402 start_codon:yes stop_codon:yes gene_type:complete